MQKIIRACTVPQSLDFVSGMIPDLTKRYEVVLLSSPGDNWAGIKRKYPEVKGIEVPMKRHISPRKDIVSLWRIYKVFRKEKPQMVHSMTPKAGLLCMIAAWLARVPVRVHTFTGLVFPTATGLKKRILMFTDWLTCACATHIIPEGEGVKRDLLSNGITKKPIKVLGFGNVKGIDLEKFNPENEYISPKEATKDTFNFIAVGRLVGDKGINELVEAFVKLNKEYPDTRLILVGPEEKELDPLTPDTLKQIKEHQAISAVGNQSDVRPWFAAANVAVLASYREGFPNVVIEAGAMGLPQIVTNINGANEIIVDGKNGTIIPPRDTDAIYIAMKRMREDDTFRSFCAANAREMIASRYEQGFVRKCLYEFYDEVCK
ncbi:MAG: glycosyltransferase family 4 protein [Prevotella sp.]|nr:glycosyltransferase family 4 protein [Prevotella sp.]MCF0209112.1 glycosyltransferase family 4 protein [Bacteroidaceae bacterium]